jgi:hypothetical protein
VKYCGWVQFLTHFQLKKGFQTNQRGHFSACTLQRRHFSATPLQRNPVRAQRRNSANPLQRKTLQRKTHNTLHDKRKVLFIDSNVISILK